MKEKDPEWIENNPTEISLEFEFNENEKNELHKNSNLKYTKPITIVFSFYERGTTIKINRRRNQSEAARDLLRIVRNYFDVIYIPTIRTSRQSIEIIDKIVSNSLSSLKNDEKYKKAYEMLREYESIKLQEISKNLTPILKQFLPNINSVAIDYYSYERSYMNNIDFIIDDGSSTSIESKGDGIKSLVQIALLKETSSHNSSLIAIEEPEAHLHPGAIHELDKILREIATNQQVILTTHNPIFADVSNLDNNYVVNEKRCYNPECIKDLRENLGVRFSDSLFSSNYVILVEGSSDVVVYRRLLSQVSPKLEKLIESNEITFYETRGASKANSFMVLMKQLLISYFVVWDNDTEGNNSYANAKASSLISDSNYMLIPCLDKKEVELEDIINPNITLKVVSDKFNVNVEGTSKKNSKWSDRIKKELELKGKVLSESLEEELKNEIAELVKNRTIDEIINIPAYKNFIEVLAQSILSYFKLDN